MHDANKLSARYLLVYNRKEKYFLCIVETENRNIKVSDFCISLMNLCLTFPRPNRCPRRLIKLLSSQPCMVGGAESDWLMGLQDASWLRVDLNLNFPTLPTYPLHHPVSHQFQCSLLLFSPLFSLRRSRGQYITR